MKKILYWISALIIIFICLEISSAIICSIKVHPRDLHNFFGVIPFNSKTYDINYRKPIIIDATKSDNILLFGDSFAYGHGLNETQNFGAKLAKYTNLNVFNRAQGGTGPQIMLYQLQSKDFKDKVADCKTILYLYSCDPPYRTVKFRNHYFQNWVSIRYTLVNNTLKLETISYILAHSYIYMLIEQWLPYMLGYDYCNNLFFKIVETSYNLSKKLYPNSTFYILYFDSSSTLGYLPFEEEFKKMGIKVIKFSDLTSENFNQLKYQNSESDPHPNEAVWEFITPLLVDKIFLTLRKNSKIILYKH